MAYKVIISPLAHTDEYEAYVWYEKQRPGLGEELLAELEVGYHKIALNPEHYGFIDDKKELRDFAVNRFPYAIIYRIREDAIEIISIHHYKKHLSKKYSNRDL